MENLTHFGDSDRDFDLAIFYTYCEWNDNLVNQIEIDFDNETYNVYYGIENYVNDGNPLFDEDEVYTTYVDNKVFDLILEGVKAKEYRKIDKVISMEKSIFYTGTNSGKAFDILVQNDSLKTYSIFFNAKNKDLACSIECPVSFCLKKRDFKKQIEKLKDAGYENDISLDVSDYDYNNRERFYTEAKCDDSLVDQIEIDEKSQKYVLILNANDYVTDGYDIFGNEIYSTYVSRGVFDLILEGVKAKGYREIKEE